MPSLNNPYSPGQFYLTQQTIANPGAGNEAALTIPPGYAYELLSIAFLFTAGVTVGNRIVSLSLEDLSGNVLFRSTLQDAVVASMPVYVRVGAGFVPRNPAAGVFPSELSWPVDLLMLGHNTLNIRIHNIKGGDAITDIRLIAKQWFST